MADDTEGLLKIYEQARTEMRHIEEQRATTTNLIILMISVIIGYFVQHDLNRSLIPLALLVIGLGFYGVIITSKLFERHQLAQNRSEHWFKQINNLQPKSKILELRSEADKEHDLRFARLSKMPLNKLWMLLHLVFIAIGVGMAILALLRG